MHRKQQLTAAALATLWLWAVLLSPMLHLVDHRADHVHGPHGTHAPSQPASSDHYRLASILGERPSGAIDATGSDHGHPHPHAAAHAHAADHDADHGDRDPAQPPARDEPRPPDPDHGAGSAQHFSLSLALAELCIEPAGLSGLSCRLSADRSVVSLASEPAPWLRRCRGPPRA